MSQHHHSNSYASSFNAIYSHSYSQSFSATRQIGNGRTRRPQRPPPLDSTFQGPSTSFHPDASSSNFPTSLSEPDFRSFSSDTNLLQRNPQQSFSRENSQTTLSNSTSSSSLSYHLSANPEDSTSILFSEDGAEDDDEMHEPEPGSFSYDPKSSQRKVERESARGTIFTKRGVLNLSTIALLIIAILALFIGYPVFNYVQNLRLKKSVKLGSVNLGGVNASGQIPDLSSLMSLIDPDTPLAVRSKTSLDGRPMKLVFSDEFNVEGRSFYPGDDPYWEAVDLHYWVTLNYEWYSPSAVTTKNGALKITLSEQPTHGLNFQGGMVSTWNSFCFTGGHVEVAARLPGSPQVSGLWPAVWSMGVLGRAGYGSTTDGMWPYSYNECDVGTLSNQTYPSGGPVAAETTGAFPSQYGGTLSYLPGQRLSRCTCADDTDHPGPKNADGSWKGRSAPEIDIIEAEAGNGPGEFGHVSMSMQLAPFDDGFDINTRHVTFFDKSTELNSYKGAVYQQAASGLVITDQGAYELSDNYYDTYGFEYIPGAPEDSAHVTWLRSSTPAWRLDAAAIGPNPRVEIGQRHIPDEPLYLIINLGLSSGFSFIDWDQLQLPAELLIDWIRVYQPEDAINVGCSPPDMPTADYISRHWEAYHNPDLTTWTEPRNRSGYAQTRPGNSLKGECSI